MPLRDVEVTLNGTVHRLRFDFGALAALEDRHEGFVELLRRRQDGEQLSMKAIISLVWAALDHEEPRPTWRDVGRWIDGWNAREVVAKIDAAAEAAFPPGPSEPVRPPAAEAAGTGMASADSPTVPVP